MIILLLINRWGEPSWITWKEERKKTKLGETLQRSAGEVSHKGRWSKACTTEQDGDQVEGLAPLSRRYEVSEPSLVPLCQKDGRRPHARAL